MLLLSYLHPVPDFFSKYRILKAASKVSPGKRVCPSNDRSREREVGLQDAPAAPGCRSFSASLMPAPGGTHSEYHACGGAENSTICMD